MKITTVLSTFLGLLILTSCSGKKSDLEILKPNPTAPSPSVPDSGADGGSGGGSGEDNSSNNGNTGLPPTTTPTISAGKIIINSGSTWTNSSLVTLSLYREESKQMKISAGPACDGGTWEPYSESKSWPLTQLNQQASISVQFIDLENRKSLCATSLIGHDSIAPAIALRLDPQNTNFSEKQHRVFMGLQENGVGLKEVRCSMNGSPVNCPWIPSKESQLDFSLVEGSYSLQVDATDFLGNTSSQQIGWVTKNQYKEMQKKVSLASDSKVDILFVIDNSGSMEFEQKSMAQRISTFSSQIANLDWQIGVTTTDPRDISFGAGRLVPMKGLTNQFVLNSKMDQNQAQKILGQTLQREEVGSGAEQGIYATYRAIERSFVNEPSANKSLFRPDAALAAIVISDEDESAQGPKNSPENLVSYIKTAWNGQKNFIFHSIIVKPGDQKCLDSQQTVFGAQYAKLSSLTGIGNVGGAIVGSVCETDYGTQLAGIGKSIQQMNQTLNVDCEPVDNKVIILRNGAQVTDPFERVGLKLVFKAGLLPGDYELSYKCLNN